MRAYSLAFGATLVVIATMNMALAQRGTGEEEGIARQHVQPTVETVSGELTAISTGRCEHTTGWSAIGTHLILKSGDDELNLHLGPATEVEETTSQLQFGDIVTAKVFRTPRLAANQYIAVSLESDGEQFVLRDDTLRPNWAGGRGARSGLRPMQGRGRTPGGVRSSQLVTSVALNQARQIDLSDEQVEQIQAILMDAEQRIHNVLTESQIEALDRRPVPGRGRGPGPR